MPDIPRAKEALEAMSQARMALILGSSGNPTRTFYATLAMRLGVEASASIPTAATDGKTLFANPDFILKLTQDERIGVVAHEVDHCTRLHMERMEGKDPTKWNIATDLHINRDLLASGFVLPSGVLNDFSQIKRSEEETYFYLPDQPKGEGGEGKPGDGQGGKGQDFEGNIGGVLPAPREAKPGETPEEAAQGRREASAKAAQEWQQAAEQAAMIARAAGTLPGHIESLIKTNKAAQVDWRQELEEFVKATVYSTDRTWARPNRRFVSQGIYMPSVIREGCGTIVYIEDISGSVPYQAHQQSSAEVIRLHSELKPERLIVLYVDTEVQKVEEFGPDDEVYIGFTGGGGTYFAPGFDWISENNIEPDVVIYLTDLYPADNPPEPPYPVLWACVTPELKWAWGRTIFLDITKE
jgi:predicted metal-dependent peptidase